MSEVVQCPQRSQQDEDYDLTAETVDRKSDQDQLVTNSKPQIKVTGVSKEHVHSATSIVAWLDANLAK